MGVAVPVGSVDIRTSGPGPPSLDPVGGCLSVRDLPPMGIGGSCGGLPKVGPPVPRTVSQIEAWSASRSVSLLCALAALLHLHYLPSEAGLGFDPLLEGLVAGQ